MFCKYKNVIINIQYIMLIGADCDIMLDDSW